MKCGAGSPVGAPVRRVARPVAEDEGGPADQDRGHPERDHDRQRLAESPGAERRARRPPDVHGTARRAFWRRGCGRRVVAHAVGHSWDARIGRDDRGITARPCDHAATVGTRIVATLLGVFLS